MFRFGLFWLCATSLLVQALSQFPTDVQFHDAIMASSARIGGEQIFSFGSRLSGRCSLPSALPSPTTTNGRNFP
jgi:hypothetical protein